MSKVTRYTHCAIYGTVSVPTGEFVTFDDYQALRADLEAMRGRLGSLGGHNLKQGMMLAQMGVEPEDLAKVSINKIKADAIRDLADDYVNGPISQELTVTYIYEHANKVEQGQ